MDPRTSARGAGFGKATVQDLTFAKFIDKSSPSLLLACLTGKHFDKATLTVLKAGGENPLDYLTITMEDLIVTNVATGGSHGDDRLTENITLNFARVKALDREQTATGGIGECPQVGWDIPGNAKL